MLGCWRCSVELLGPCEGPQLPLQGHRVWHADRVHDGVDWFWGLGHVAVFQAVGVQGPPDDPAGTPFWKFSAHDCSLYVAVPAQCAAAV